ncbi:hypothetical protein KGA66_01355 [Actinocrinis puniceicyclus]|uniref:Uncharacterized protein n=1 Tax=Actinocrinis puniceicyclus TaxID=977794 RepID=A0A8J8BAR8_9ACTN|nr:hypothetical protein [Actinocrinis puniceicyclus]MBS2961675.1 hypothetical protein [Actinocrinis puniceicyclus]
MAAQDPGDPRVTHPAHEGTPTQPEITRLDVTETAEVGPEGVAELEIVERSETFQAAAGPQPYGQAPHSQTQAPAQPQPPYASQSYAQPNPLQPNPLEHPQARGQQPAYPQMAYPQMAYPQPAYYGWGVPTAPVPPPQPKVSLPPRTLIAASALVGAAVVALVAGFMMAAPSGGSAAKRTTGAAARDQTIRAVWRTATVEQLLPAAIKREGTETYVRLGVNPDQSCAKLPGAFVSALAPDRCAHLLTATYADRTQTVTATVGIVVIGGSSADRLRLFQSWTPDSNADNAAMMPHTYPVPGTVAARFSDSERVAWQSQASSDGTYLVYVVAGFTDGRTGPGAAAVAAGSGSALSSSSPAVQVAGDLPAAIQDLITARTNSAEAGVS